MERQQLRELLEQLHSELEHTRQVDDQARELLGEVLGDIRVVLERTGEEPPHHPETLIERLKEATRHFEQSHPTLASAVGRLANALSNLGI